MKKMTHFISYIFQSQFGLFEPLFFKEMSLLGLESALFEGLPRFRLTISTGSGTFGSFNADLFFARLSNLMLAARLTTTLVFHGLLPLGFTTRGTISVASR